jgi:hypothetical protein
MIRLVALCASVFLTACSTTRSAPADVPTPLAPDPRLCQPLKPEPPVQGGLVAPVTDQERADLAAFLNGEAAARDWGRQGWARAAIALKVCP